jgi:glycosyltransferase involved in cell wall biosynthesis
VKILFFSGHAHLALDLSADRASGGAELQVALLSRQLTALGHEVVLLAADTGLPDKTTLEGIRIRNGGRFDTGGVKDMLQSLPRVISILREEKPDYVVFYGWTTWLYLIGRLRFLTGFKVAFVCALDGEIDGTFRRENPIRGAIFEEGMRLADARLAITNHEVSLFQAKGMSCSLTRLQLQKTQVHPSPVKEYDLLWVARCQPVKRPGLFLDMAEHLPHARCRMICSPQDQKLWVSIRDRAATLPNVEFFERVPYHEIQSHFDAARIFVNTSTDEGVPNTFIHSGLGRTAILSLVVNPDGVLGHFQAGLCAEGDFDRLCQEAQRLLDDPVARNHAGDECARFLSEWHDNATNMQAFLKGLTA